MLAHLSRLAGFVAKVPHAETTPTRLRLRCIMIEATLELYGVGCMIGTVAFLVLGWARGRGMAA
jgi:hypothetical protein